MVASRRVAVVGGGVSGLATAYHLTRELAQEPGLQVTLLESEPRLGGKIATEPVAGTGVDTGPDAVLMRSPAASTMIKELGLDARLRPPAGGGAYLWTRGRLRPLPAGSIFGVPDRLWPLLRSGLLGPVGFVRAGADLVLPRRVPDGDPTIEQLLRPRFGRQVFERLVEPMLGGVHAGRAGRLSARSAVPEVAALSSRSRSLYLAMRRRAPGAGRGSAGGPALMTLEGGLFELVEALRKAVEAAPDARIVTGAHVDSLTRSGGAHRLEGSGFEAFDVDDVVLATPAYESARLLRPEAPAASVALESIPYAGVATVILAYPSEAVPAPLVGTGFLVPPVEGRLLVGCSWLSTKWPHLTPPPGTVLLRAMVGRDGDQAWAALNDTELIAAVRAELSTSMGVEGEPVAVHVRRMPAAMPQYTVGHADRLAAAESALAGAPGIHLTGAGYRGVGIAGCLAQAREAAAAVRSRLSPVGAR